MTRDPARSGPASSPGRRRSFIVTRLGYEGVLSGSASWPEIRARLAEYPLGQVLEVIAQISAAGRFTDYYNPEFNQQLVNRLFGYKAQRVLEALEHRVHQETIEGMIPEIAVFDDAQLIMGAKYALSALSPSAPEWKISTIRLCEALLMIGELLGDQQLPKETETPTSLESWTHFMGTNVLFYHQGDHVHEFARTYELYLTSHSRRPGRGYQPPDFPSIVLRATGVTGEEYWAIAFALLAAWTAKSAEAAFSTPAWIDADSYFTANLTFDQGRARAFIDLFAQDASELRRLIKDVYTDIVAVPFNPLPLATFPLVRIERKICCPSVKLLSAKMTTGLYHLLLNALTTDAQRNTLNVHLGDVVEDYVRRLFERVFGSVPRHPQGVYLAEDQIQHALSAFYPRDTPPVCDGVILAKDAVILIEVKASRFSLAQRSDQDPDGYLDKLRRICLNALNQIDQTIGHIESGRLRSIGVDPNRIRRFFPLVVTLEPIAIFAPMYRYLSSLATMQPRTALQPWQLFTIEELECAEGAMIAGKSLLDFLSKKTANQHSREESATNFSFETGDRFAFQRRSPYLEGVYRTLAEQTTAFFRGNARDSYLESPRVLSQDG